MNWMVLSLCFVAPGIFGGQVQKELNQRLKGAWVILESQVWSVCDSGYTNNKVNDTRVLASSGLAFQPGELAQVVKVDLKRSRVDVHLSLGIPYRVSWVDGPFQLYDHRSCYLELQITLPREMVKKKQTDAIEQKIRKILEVFPSREAAMDSSSFNGRQTEPLPADYDRTLAEYEAWKIEQQNKLTIEEIQKSRQQASYILKSARDSAEYGRGFVRGLRDMTRDFPVDCDTLLNATFFSYKKTISSETRDFKDGYKDGQLLAFHMTRAERLEGCLR